MQDAERIRRGAGNYDSMCVICHLAPGVAPTELHNGLYPQPPKLAKATEVNPARAFWVVKHGIKASGMLAWGKSMEDPYIWDRVAFLTKMPTMTPEQYAAVVTASGGHSHGGGETAPHGRGGAHEPAATGHEHTAGQAAAPDLSGQAAATAQPNAPDKAHAHDKPHAQDKPSEAAAKGHHHAKGTKPHAH